MSVAIVTDSTSDLPQELAEQFGITVVPLYVNFGDRQYKDREDISSERFFQMLTTEKEFPRTTQPAVGEFLECYKGLLEKHEAVVSAHISAKLSGTYNAAVAAREELKDDKARVEVIDTKAVTMALGLAAMAAARKAQSGAGADEVAAAAREASDKVEFFCTAETIKYLQKGGRIGKAQYALGSLLNLRPIAVLRDGETAALARARSMKKARQRMVEELRNHLPVESAFVMHTNTNKEVAEEFRAQLLEAMPELKDMQLAPLGPITGAHIGPGGLGVSLLRT